MLSCFRGLSLHLSYVGGLREVSVPHPKEEDDEATFTGQEVVESCVERLKSTTQKAGPQTASAMLKVALGPT